MIEIIITENQLEFLVKSSNDKTDGILNEIKIPRELINIITKLGLNDVSLISSIKKNMDVTPDQFKK